MGIVFFFMLTVLFYAGFGWVLFFMLTVFIFMLRVFIFMLRVFTFMLRVFIFMLTNVIVAGLYWKL